MIALVMGNAFPAHGLHDDMEYFRCRHTGSNALDTLSHALVECLVFGQDFLRRFTETCDPGDIGTVIAIVAPDIEADDVAATKRPGRWLHVHQGTALTETDAAKNRKAVFLNSLRMEGARQIAFHRAFPCDRQGCLHRSFGNLGNDPQSFYLFRSLHGANRAEG
ncbi:hypothetical protein D3C87_1191280 [compost metagenome]